MSIEDDSMDKDGSARKGQQEELGASDSFELPELPQIVLPEIVLPEIPELDLDSLLAKNTLSDVNDEKKSAPEEFSIDEYGSHGTGPLSIADIQSVMKVEDNLVAGAPPSSSFQVRSIDVPSITIPEIKFNVPKGAQIQDTGLGPAYGPVSGNTETVADVVKGKPEVSPKGIKGTRKTPKKNRGPKSSRKSNRERQTKASSGFSGAQAPLGERVIDFGGISDEADSVNSSQDTVVNLDDGYIECDGSFLPIDANLRASLVKVRALLLREFVAVDRAQILGRIRKAAHHSQANEDILKLLVTPILRLGKKRYAVINDLLKMKDSLPKLSNEIFIAYLDALLGGS